MCLIAFAWNAHPRFPLVIAANRDEFHARPAAPLGPWPEVPGVWGGRDLREGGGWLALSTAGRLAAVTNFRESRPRPAPRSRGRLVRDFLSLDQGCAAGHAERLQAEAREYGAFNLLLWDGADLVHASNRPEPSWSGVPRGVHGISNGAFEPGALRLWPKVRQASAALARWLGAQPLEAGLSRLDCGPLFQALAEDRPADDSELPDTGVGLDMERRLAPPFIRGSEYGTRCSTVLLIDRGGVALFIERRFGPGGIPDGERRQTLQFAPPRHR
jgi:uncharacterized protein with NRDE domain